MCTLLGADLLLLGLSRSRETGSAWQGGCFSGSRWRVCHGRSLFSLPGSSGQGTVPARCSWTTSSPTPYNRVPGRLPANLRPTAHCQDPPHSGQFLVNKSLFLSTMICSLPNTTVCPAVPPQQQPAPQTLTPKTPQKTHPLPHATVYKSVVGVVSGRDGGIDVPMAQGEGSSTLASVGTTVGMDPAARPVTQGLGSS